VDEYVLLQWYDSEGNYDGRVMMTRFNDRETLKEFLNKLDQRLILYKVVYRSDKYTPNKVD
jgi:hypothetical protein